MTQTIEQLRQRVTVSQEEISGLLTRLREMTEYANKRNDQLAKAEQLWQIAQGRCDGLEEKLAKAEQRVAEVTALNPILEILDPARRLFIIANRLELKYLPIYADQPDPTYITKWVWEVRDQFGASVCEAHEWLYQAIDNAEKAISANGASS